VLTNQVFLGSDYFVNEVKAPIEDDKDLSEISFAQKRPVAKPLNYYVKHYQSRDDTICAAFESGGYSMKQIGEYFELHYSTISRIVGRAARDARPDPIHIPSKSTYKQTC